MSEEVEQPYTPAVVVADAMQLAYGGAEGDEIAYDYWGTGADSAAEMLRMAIGNPETSVDILARLGLTPDRYDAKGNPLSWVVEA